MSQHDRIEKVIYKSAYQIMSEQPISLDNWYYSIELKPGTFTNGIGHPNIATTRAALSATEVKNCKCLDIGTQEGMIPILLKRRDASYVAAQDVIDRHPRIDLVKRMLGIEFDYYGGVPLSELRSKTRESGNYPFDVVVISGVLYHMLDPFTGLAAARSLVRSGGMLIVETQVALVDEMAILFNDVGKFGSDRTLYSILTATCLDYMLRFFWLRPLDCIYLPAYRDGGVPMTRVCVPCRAVDTPLPGEGDQWMSNRRDYGELLKWDELEELRNNQNPVSYKPTNKNAIIRQDTGTVDIYRTILERGTTGAPPHNLLRLGLHDKF